MIAICSAPKPFRGHIKLIQYNAIRSWKKVHPDVQVVLIGNEEGIEQAATELGTLHIPEVECNEFGTPLISSLFSLAHKATSHNFLCYVNADIIFTSSFLSCLVHSSRTAHRFVMVGKRWDLSQDQSIDFEAVDWEDRLLAYTRQSGKQATAWQIDFFAFPKTEYESVPPFAVGRVRWDNWMIWHARANNVMVIDTSAFIVAVHQNHDYAHHAQGQKGVWEGQEALVNHELAGGWDHVYSISDASHYFINLFGRPLLTVNVLSKARDFNRYLNSISGLYRLCSRIVRMLAMVKNRQWTELNTEVKKKIDSVFHGKAS